MEVDKFLFKEFLPEIEFADVVNSVPIGLWNKTLIIDFYHPSYRAANAMSFALLQNVVESS